MKAALLLTAAALLAPSAFAQTRDPTPIFRCGEDGTTYSQKPCAGGTVVESSDGRTGAQRAQAVRTAAQERRLAAQMAKERRLREAAERKANKPLVLRPSTAASGPRHTQRMTERTQSHTLGKPAMPATDAAAPGNRPKP